MGKSYERDDTQQTLWKLGTLYKGISGQVWCLEKIHGTLFCGHDHENNAQVTFEGITMKYAIEKDGSITIL